MAVPFWARLWPAAMGLCRYLENNPELIAGKKVLELAAGLGLPSLVAALGAKEVWCTDYDEAAVAWAQHAAALSHLSNMRHFTADWNHLPPTLACDTLLLSDVNYEPAQFETLHRVLEQFLKMGTLVILSTPQRLMAKPFIEGLLPWCRQAQQFEVAENNNSTAITVLQLAL